MQRIGIAAALIVAFWTGQATASSLTVDGFESGLPSGVDSNGIPVGYYTFQDSGSAVGISTTDTPPASVPGSTSGNSVLQMDTVTSSFGLFAGFLHAFTNSTADQWVPQDWSGHDRVSFWVYGSNSSTDLFFDILDNRNPLSTSDDAERWTVTFKDDFAGWKQFEFGFDGFVRKDIGNGAPNDGLSLTAIHGFAFGSLYSSGSQTFYFDDVALVMPSAVPLPASAFLLGFGLLGLGALARRRAA